jgi:hypothetical protein
VTGQTDSDVGDIFAGCFLSLAGSLVGSVVGAVSVFLLNFPEVGIGRAIVRFAVGFVAGVVVGFVATFALGPIAKLFGRSRAENIWIGGVAVSAATGAAVTTWRLFPV